MTRLLLPAVTGLLFALVVADRMTRVLSTTLSAAPGVPAPDRRGASVPSAAAPADARAPAAPAPAPLPGEVPRSASTLDRLARLAVRQHLAREAGQTYLDSLIASTDSVVRRWPDRNGAPLRVAIVEGGVPGYDPHLGTLVRRALARWNDAAIGIQFAEVPDTSGADVVVRWIDRFRFDRAGQTDLTWDQFGRVRHASIALALRATTGDPLGDAALLAVAVHEAGHALGLPHSADAGDAMYPSTRTDVLSDRDLRTAALLYQLPPGSVKDLPDP